jgi:hypothetical protein
MTAQIDCLPGLLTGPIEQSESVPHRGQRLLGWLDCSEVPLRAPDRGFSHCSPLTPTGVGATPRGRPLPAPDRDSRTPIRCRPTPATSEGMNR